MIEVTWPRGRWFVAHEYMLTSLPYTHHSTHHFEQVVPVADMVFDSRDHHSERPVRRVRGPRFTLGRITSGAALRLAALCAWERGPF